MLSVAKLWCNNNNRVIKRSGDLAEVKFFRTPLASRTSSRTYFKILGLEAQVLGLGLEAYKSSKMSCPRLNDSVIIWLVEKESNQTKDNITISLSIRFFF